MPYDRHRGWFAELFQIDVYYTPVESARADSFHINEYDAPIMGAAPALNFLDRLRVAVISRAKSSDASARVIAYRILPRTRERMRYVDRLVRLDGGDLTL